MQVSQLFLETSSTAYENPIGFVKVAPQPERRPKVTFRPPFPMHNAQVNATDCIALITDPLWKNVCREVLHRMGEISFLKIWKSELGESPLPGQDFEITCETKESAYFLRQYDFVIISILNDYFPRLKNLKILIRDGV